MDDVMTHDATPTDDGYEAPALRDYGTIAEWTKGTLAQAIQISVII